MQVSGESNRILIVDDDPGQRSLLSAFLERQGFHLFKAESGPMALKFLEANDNIRLMISDVRMPGMNGLELMQAVRRQYPTLPILLVTAFPDVKDAVHAMRDGAINYLEKPIDLDELNDSVSRALGAQKPGERPTEQIDQAIPEGVIAVSPQMREIFREICFVAPTDSRVLITGESGSGKEVVADLLHRFSSVVKGPLVKVNCAAIPSTLLESELFGHEKGSFTGAVKQHQGCFEQAHGGTLFLDEIAETSPELQAKLLRVVQDGRLRRVGGMKDIQVDVRLLAATNRDLETEVRENRFREDLFFRLNVFEIHIPPLRDRPADILPLAMHFAEKYARVRVRLSPATVSCLELYKWPGNVRELANAMERAVLMSRGELVLPEHLPPRVRQGSETAPGAVEVESNSGNLMEDIERNVILQTLAENEFNRSETARVLGISRRSLIYKLQRYRELGHQVEPPTQH